MDSGLIQTVLLLAAPYLVPKAFRLAQSFLNPQPKGQRHPVHVGLSGHARRLRTTARDSPRLAAFRLFVCAMGMSIAVVSALNPPENLFLSLSSPHSTLSRLFPFLRHPLDIRLSTETLARAWSHSLRLRPLRESELALLSRLQTLDARLMYIACGAGPLMNCGWCRPPGAGISSTTGVLGADYLLALAPPTAIAYLAALAGCGLLLSGNGREKWRSWIVVLLLGGAGAEVWSRLTWDGARGVAASGAAITMIHSQIHVLRSLFFAILLALSYLAPAAPLAHSPPGTSTIIAPAIAAITSQTEDVLHRLRALSIARMAVLHEDGFRKQITEFWSSASHESRLARSDPAIRSFLETQLRQTPGGPSETFEAWVGEAMSLPGEGKARRASAREKTDTEEGQRAERGNRSSGRSETAKPERTVQGSTGQGGQGYASLTE
ncbi:hypothetical protein JCM10908_003345 [Rhodotorula pacifica]|uniref:uncharacterized protein n=1 Tax=Rhodotorula pacifica TaxID=1495444 RepID=UPI00317D7060